MAGYPYTPNGYSGYNPYNYQTAVPNVNACNSYYPTAVPLQQPQLTGYSQASVDMSSYATHDEIDELKKMIGDLKSSMTREGKQDGRKPTV